MPVVPGRTLCLRCIFDAPPPPELSPTCDTAGVIAPAVAVAAAMQCTEALKILAGKGDALTAQMVHLDVWTGQIARIQAARTAEAPNCVCCVQRKFEYLDGNLGSVATHLCGRNAVQIHRAGDRPVDFAALSARLNPIAEEPVTHNAFLLRARIDGHLLTLFSDGRAIVQGTDNVDRARTLYAKYIGA
jgi:adenylyltransferase/sulfurtransferase